MALEGARIASRPVEEDLAVVVGYLVVHTGWQKYPAERRSFAETHTDSEVEELLDSVVPALE